jgi:hypothetical protein
LTLVVDKTRIAEYGPKLNMTRKYRFFVGVFFAAFGLSGPLALSAFAQDTVAVFDFGPEDRGDCQMRNAKLVLYSNGNAVFDADVRTKQTTGADFWRMSLTFVGPKPEQIVMFQSGRFSSPALRQGAPFIHWHIEFNAGKNNGFVTTVEDDSSC